MSSITSASKSAAKLIQVISLAGLAQIAINNLTNPVYGYYNLRVFSGKLTAASILAVQFSQDNGVSYFSGATDYSYMNAEIGAAAANTSEGAVNMVLNANDAAGIGVANAPFTLDLDLYNLQDTTVFKSATWILSEPNSTTRHNMKADGCGSFINNVNAVNAFKVYPVTATTFTQGTALLYGYRNV